MGSGPFNLRSFFPLTQAGESRSNGILFSYFVLLVLLMFDSLFLEQIGTTYYKWKRKHEVKVLKRKWCGNCFCCACIMLVEMVKTTMLLEAGGRSQNFKLHNIFMKQKKPLIYI